MQLTKQQELRLFSRLNKISDERYQRLCNNIDSYKDWLESIEYNDLDFNYDILGNFVQYCGNYYMNTDNLPYIKEYLEYVSCITKLNTTLRGKLNSLVEQIKDEIIFSGASVDLQAIEDKFNTFIGE